MQLSSFLTSCFSYRLFIQITDLLVQSFDQWLLVDGNCLVWYWQFAENILPCGLSHGSNWTWCYTLSQEFVIQLCNRKSWILYVYCVCLRVCVHTCSVGVGRTLIFLSLLIISPGSSGEDGGLGLFLLICVVTNKLFAALSSLHNAPHHTTVLTTFYNITLYQQLCSQFLYSCGTYTTGFPRIVLTWT